MITFPLPKCVLHSVHVFLFLTQRLQDFDRYNNVDVLQRHNQIYLFHLKVGLHT